MFVILGRWSQAWVSQVHWLHENGFCFLYVNLWRSSFHHAGGSGHSEAAFSMMDFAGRVEPRLLFTDLFIEKKIPAMALCAGL